VAIDVGWNTTDYENTGGAGELLQPLVPQGKGAGAALPISINALTLSKPCNVVGAPAPCAASPLPSSATKYFVQTDLPKQATRTGVVAMEGHPAWPFPQGDGTTVWERVPVKSEFRYFAITDNEPKLRREIVAIEKCKVCHTGEPNHDGVVIPRLSLHGANRTEEPRVCAICHNPDQTDIPYRPAGAEVSIDFKRMVHSIHAGGFRKYPFQVVGFQGVLYDFSAIRFPKELRNCLNCHVEVGGKGTFELPLAPGVLGSTVSTGSMLGGSLSPGKVDVDPANDRKITPIAAVCSSCHDSYSAQVHMSSGRQGGNFWALQKDITSGLIKERCVECHGPGRDKDVRRVHEVGLNDD
jgi:OmcA/MtrC family decaheme c-type cytochrome